MARDYKVISGLPQPSSVVLNVAFKKSFTFVQSHCKVVGMRRRSHLKNVQVIASVVFTLITIDLLQIYLAFIAVHRIHLELLVTRSMGNAEVPLNYSKREIIDFQINLFVTLTYNIIYLKKKLRNSEANVEKYNR